MRKWHRWLVVIAGAFILWIAATGLIGQVYSLAGGEHHDGPPPASRPAPGPQPMTQAVHGDDHEGSAGKHEGPPQDLYHFIIDLHSGNYFGIVGKVASAVMGAALLFFAGSGIWMYIDMFRRRRRAGRSEVFWD